MDDGASLWERVCATVNRLGGPRSPRARRVPTSPPARLIDLHGLTVQEAYREARAFLSETPHREVVIVTGKSGVIRSEFPYWIEAHPRVASWTMENAGGSFSIRIKA